jgi:drug/metabolite transporter (DMT)-like permease
MPATVLDDWKVLPRLMMLAVTVLTYQAVHWFMSLDDPSVAQSGLVSVCMGALTGCFGIWMGKESKTTVTQTETSSKVEYDVDR